MAFNTYSFKNVTVVIEHPSIGSMSTEGDGVGSISIAMSNDKSSHNLAADGTVMISKIAGSNGTVAIAVQQVSQSNEYLKKLYNYCEANEDSSFAATTIRITDKNANDIYTCTGVTPQKLADAKYAAQGDLRTWNMLAAEITTA